VVTEHPTSESALQAAQELRTVVGRLRRRLAEMYDPKDLTPSQLSIISRLHRDGEASASDLASAERIRPQSVATTLTALADQGMVERRADPHDRRRQLVGLTPAGRAVFEQRGRSTQEWLARALDEHCTERERQQLIAAVAVLERLLHP